MYVHMDAHLDYWTTYICTYGWAFGLLDYIHMYIWMGIWTIGLLDYIHTYVHMDGHLDNWTIGLHTYVHMDGHLDYIHMYIYVQLPNCRHRNVDNSLTVLQQGLGAHRRSWVIAQCSFR
jgi:hypothetical protein